MKDCLRKPFIAIPLGVLTYFVIMATITMIQGCQGTEMRQLPDIQYDLESPEARLKILKAMYKVADNRRNWSRQESVERLNLKAVLLWQIGAEVDRIKYSNQ